MIAQWMLAAMTIGVLLAVAGRCIAELHSRLGFPRRWLWLALMVISTAAPVAMAIRVGPTQRLDSTANAGQTACCAPSGGPGTQRPFAAVSDRPYAAVSDSPYAALSDASFDAPLLVGWAVISLTLATGLAAGHQRTKRRMQSWTRAELHGAPVVIAPDFGPAAVGVIRSTVVMPEWVLELPIDEQRLVLRHELEHIRAGDQFVLFAGVLLAVLMPWNVALWWQLRRLRIGLELDCDARVAPTVRERPRYADLLLRARTRQPRYQTALGFVSTRSALAERLYALLERRQPTGAQMTVWSVSAMACVGVLTRVPVPSVRPLFEKPVQELAMQVEAPVAAQSGRASNRAPAFASATPTVAGSTFAGASRAASSSNNSGVSSVADLPSTSTITLPSRSRKNGATGTRSAARLPVTPSRDTGFAETRVRYDVLLPFDLDRLKAASISQLCATCGAVRGGRATPSDYSAKKPSTESIGALDVDGRPVGSAAARRIGPDSLPTRD